MFRNPSLNLPLLCHLLDCWQQLFDMRVSSLGHDNTPYVVIVLFYWFGLPTGEGFFVYNGGQMRYNEAS